MPPPPKQGWKGNLTREQETKLKEMWEQILQITGVIQPKLRTNSVVVANSNGAATALTNSPVDAGKKKKRFGFFSRHDDSESSQHGGSHASGGSDNQGNSAAEADDKYGQTKEFKAALAEQSPAQLREAIWSFTKADDPDALLLRFLRARKWDVEKALAMLIAATRWRAREIHLDDDLMLKGEAWFAEKEKHGTNPQDKKLGGDFITQLRMGKSFVHGTDKEGRPMCFVRVRLHKGGEQSEESLEKFTVYTIETTRLMLTPPVDTAMIVFDMTNFAMANLDYTPVKFMIKCFEANYPESLGAICVHRSPWIFNTAWTMIRGWLDPVVASKVHFTKDASELEQFVPRANIPKELGGDEDWEYKYKEPNPGENREMREGERDGRLELARAERWEIVDRFEKETARWCRGEGGGGSEKDEDAEKNRTELAKELRRNYWKLDPFVRGKSLYDRIGVIKGGGEVDMYPESSSSTAKASVDGNDDGVD
ncbi:MAG: hypothetical protein M1831_006469 [Alyxoria varia]|nr:MAG: hypothetical protein M1831_006469 [Alyxoria varia]